MGDDDAKEKFEKEREEILKSLPEEVKSMFGVIGFCRGEEEEDDDDDEEKVSAIPYYQPVLIVSPYDVPPKPVRDIYWMDSYTKAKRSKAKLKKLDHLVYVYGSDDPDDCYNFVTHDDFISYEDGLRKDYNTIPDFISSKPDADKTEFETRLIRGMEEMKLDVDKVPSDRKHGTPFLERYEKLKKGDGPPSKKQKKT